MLPKSGEISPMASASAMTPAQEMHTIICEMVDANRHDGIERAIVIVARELGLTASRVTEIRKGRSGRIWADEYIAARERYARFLHRQEQKLELQAARVRALRASTQERLDAGLTNSAGKRIVVDRRNRDCGI